MKKVNIFQLLKQEESIALCDLFNIIYYRLFLLRLNNIYVTYSKLQEQ